MTQHKKTKGASVPSPVGHVVPFGPPPVIYGEDPAAFNKILEDVFSALRPRYVFEREGATAYADRLWTIQRLRVGKASYLNAHAADGLKLVLAPLLDYDPAPGEEFDKQAIAEWEIVLEDIDPFAQGADCKYDTTNGYLQRLRSALCAKQRAARDEQLQAWVDPWGKRDPDGVKKVDEKLAAAGKTMADVMAATQDEHWTEINVFDHHIAEAEKEAAAILREFHWRRRNLTPLLDDAKEIDGECQDMTSTDGKAA